jgi:hypothetical protein
MIDLGCSDIWIQDWHSMLSICVHSDYIDFASVWLYIAYRGGSVRPLSLGPGAWSLRGNWRCAHDNLNRVLRPTHY